jgi:hypothetical protein
LAAPDEQLQTIDGALTLVVEQIAGPQNYCRYLINAVVFVRPDTDIVSGYYDTVRGSSTAIPV